MDSVFKFIQVVGALEDTIFQKRMRLLQRDKNRRAREKSSLSPSFSSSLSKPLRTTTDRNHGLQMWLWQSFVALHAPPGGGGRGPSANLKYSNTFWSSVESGTWIGQSEVRPRDDRVWDQCNSNFEGHPGFPGIKFGRCFSARQRDCGTICNCSFVFKCFTSTCCMTCG
jgi:hypothetical protein